MVSREDFSQALKIALLSPNPLTTQPSNPTMDSPFINHYALLNSKQKSVFEECLKKGSGAMSIPMGGGKTLTSIVLGLQLKERSKNKKPVLVVMKKTLIGGWETEIAKFFGKRLKVLVFHPSYIKDLENKTVPVEDYDLVLTTIDVLAKYYRKGMVESFFVERVIENEGMFGQHIINLYHTPKTPFISIPSSGFVLHSTFWSCLIVDEVQLFTNIETDYCKSIGSVCAEHRWALSGTIFNEPKTSKILGYFVIIGDEFFPRTLPAAKLAVQSRDFNGYSRTLVERSKDNLTYSLPPIHENTITHTLSKEEEKLYVSIRGVMMKVKAEYQKYKAARDIVHQREFGSYLLVTLTYLRQLIVCPLIPITKIVIDMTDLGCKSQLSTILNKSIGELGLGSWLDDPKSIRSSRFDVVLNTMEKHKDQRVVIFTCFRRVLDVLMYCEGQTRPHYTIYASDSIKKRKSTIEEFSKSNNGALYLTYDIGAEGLNLQAAAVALLVDYWWNDGKTQQAMARIVRQGQMNAEVNVYYFTSNTQVENAIFRKHADKLSILKELREGSTQRKVQPLSMNDLVKIITVNEVYTTLQSIREIKK